MANPNRAFEVTLSALKARGCHVGHEWLHECINFFCAENNRYTLKDLENFVFEQWSLGDLGDIAGGGSFPPNLSAILKTTLCGKMACQIQFLTDIGHSSYTQMQKLRKEDVGNLQVDEVGREFQQAWEPKSNRMLQLSLFDGAQTVKAIEYRPIPSLKTDLIPGTKILLQGPILCRRGVLMLEEKHLTVLGGEVDAIVVTNAYENVLARKLNVPENPDPYNLTGVGDEPQAQPGNPVQQNGHGQAPAPARPPRDPQQQRQNVQAPAQPPVAPTHPRPNAQAPARPPVALPQQRSTANQIRQPMQATTSSVQDQSSRRMVQATLSWSKPAQHVAKPAAETELMEFCGDDDVFLNIPMNDVEMEFKDEPASNSWNKKEHHTTDYDMGSDEEAALLAAEASLALNTAEERITDPSNVDRETIKDCFSSKRPASSALPEESLRKPLFSKRRKETSSQEVSSTTDLNFLLADDFLDQEETLPKDSSHSGSATHSILPAHPFVYLSQIIKCKKESPETCRVKAAVITVIEKLSISDGEWKLSAKITDGSANVDVRFSSKVLEELIGMSAEAMTKLRKEMAVQPEKKEIVRKKLEQAQGRLINLNCLFDLKMSLNQDRPVVVGLENISIGTVTALKSRQSKVKV